MASSSSVSVKINVSGVDTGRASLDKLSDSFKKAGESAKTFDSQADKLKDVGKKFRKFGKQLTKYVTLPLTTAAVGMGKLFSNLESSIAKVGTLTSDSFDLTELTQDILDQSKVTGLDASDLTQNIYRALTASVPEDYVLEFNMDAHKLATAGFTDEATAIEVLTTAINAYGYEAKDATKVSDLLIGTQDRGKTTVEDLGHSLGVVIPIAANNNLSFEQLSASMALMTRNGIDTTRASTYLRAMLQELGKSGSDVDEVLNELAGKGFRELMDEGYDLTDVLQMLDKYAGENDITLQDLFGNVRAGTGAMSLMGEGGAELAELIDHMGGVAGRTDENFEDMTKTMQYKTKVAFNRLKTAGYETAMNLAPVWEKVADVMVTVAGKVEGAANWFQGLSDATQGNIIKGGLLLAALGPVVSILGGLLTVTGTVAGAIGVMSGALTVASPAALGLATAFGFMSSPITAAIVGIAGITSAGAILVRHFSSDAIPAVNLFGDEVSESTEQAVGSFMDMTKEANVQLKELSWGQKTVTQEMANDMKAKQSEITTTLLTAIDERNEEELATMEKQFDNISGLTETEKENAKQKLNERFEDEHQITEEGNQRINNIIENASNDGRAIREDEAKEIEYIRESMNISAVEVMSQGALEQQAILEQMRVNSGTITALEAAEVIQNSVAKKEGTIQEAEDQYDETVAWAILQRDEHGTLSASEAARVIEEAELQRSESVSKAESMHEDIVEEAELQAGEHIYAVDRTTGEVLSKMEQLSRRSSEIQAEMGEAIRGHFKDYLKRTREDFGLIVSTIESNWKEGMKRTKTQLKEIGTGVTGHFKDYIKRTKEDFGEITSTIKTNWSNAVTDTKTELSDMKTSIKLKWKNIKSDASTKWDEIKSKVTDPIKSAKETVSGYVEDIKGFFTNLKLKIPKPSLPSMPKFSLKTSSRTVLGKTIAYPSGIGINWNAEGGIFNKATLLGGGQGVGEAGAEAVLPLNRKTLAGIGAGVGKTVGNNSSGRAGEDVDTYVRKHQRRKSSESNRDAKTSNKNPVPVELVLPLGTKEFRWLVDDITDLQDKRTEFKTQYSL